MSADYFATKDGEFRIEIRSHDKSRTLKDIHIEGLDPHEGISVDVWGCAEPYEEDGVTKWTD